MFYLDQPFGVVLRGFVVIVPSVEISLILMCTILICTKFKNLAEATQLTLEGFQTKPPGSPIEINYLTNTPISYQSGLVLEKLPETHEDIFSSLRDFNKCLGLQLLMAVVSSLYTMIYYLYRYGTSSETGMTSNTHERVHYVIGLSYRIGKLVLYMILGQNIVQYVSTRLPIRASGIRFLIFMYI